jgi:hypothetical protein
LRGHRDQITAIRFLSIDSRNAPSNSTTPGSGLLLTASKDTFLKLWDLSTQHCIQTVVAHRAEIWTLDLDVERGLLFTGSGEGELKAWSIDIIAFQEGLKESSSGQVCHVFICTWCEVLPLHSRYQRLSCRSHPFLFHLAIAYPRLLSTQASLTLRFNRMNGPSKSSEYVQRKRSGRSKLGEGSAPKKSCLTRARIPGRRDRISQTIRMAMKRRKRSNLLIDSRPIWSSGRLARFARLILAQEICSKVAKAAFQWVVFVLLSSTLLRLATTAVCCSSQQRSGGV